jgi:hypothetical protein
MFDTPGFRQPEREHERIGFLEHAAYSCKMTGPGRQKVLSGGESRCLDARSKGVDQSPVRPTPHGIDGLEKTVGPVEQLEQLPDRVDIAEPGWKHAEVLMASPGPGSSSVTK